MIHAEELQKIPVFAELPKDQIDWFLTNADEVLLHSGDTFVRQGDPADWMFVFLQGHFQWRGEFGGDTVVLPASEGDESGIYPFSRMKQFTVTGRAITDGRLLRFPSSCFPELVQKMPELTTRLVAMMSDRIREGTRIEQQRDRLISLGKLAAGLAHELNNPSAAANRAAGQLAALLTDLKVATFELGKRCRSEEQKLEIEILESSLAACNSDDSNPLALYDLEEQIGEMLSRYDERDAWQVSSALARCNLQPELLDRLLANLDRSVVHAAVTRIAASVNWQFW